MILLISVPALACMLLRTLSPKGPEVEPMTDEMMSLRALVEKTPDADVMREMIGFAAERLMELQVGALTGAPYGEKSAERLSQRTTRFRNALHRGPPHPFRA